MISFKQIIFVFLVVTLSCSFAIGKTTFATNSLTIDSQTTPQDVTGPIRYKVIASINGETQAKKTSTITDPNVGTIDIPFAFKKANDIVKVGFHDEFFVCGYILDASKDLTKSYSCNEGDLLSPDEVNTAPLKSFLTIPDGKSKINDVKINVLVPYYDKLEGVKMKVVAMVKGEFQSKVIVIDRKQATASDPEGTAGKRIVVPFTFDRNTDIGKIQPGDEYFACVSADALNPPSGTACEHRHIKSFDSPNELASGHIR
jgi:hypothetical protein